MLKMHRRKLICGTLTLCLPSVRGYAAQTDGVRIALVQVTESSRYFNEITRGVRNQSSRLGFSLSVFDADNSPVAQSDAIENYAEQKVSAILLCAIDVYGVRDAIDTAARFGVPVIAIDAIVAGKTVSQIGVDNARTSAALLDALLRNPVAGGGRRVNVGVVGAASSYIQTLRYDGFLSAMKMRAPLMHVSGFVDGQNILDTAQTAAEDLLAAVPDVDLIYATGEPAMIGVLSALQTSPPRKPVHLAGWDMSPEIEKALKNGTVLATAVQDTVRMGEAAVSAARDWLRKTPQPHDITVPASIFTPQTFSVSGKA
ncbi:substrate-binding domain-containing protein [Acetobacter oeni]|uniref:Sugar ABC transporter substrate-binding protein n=1 Tax=Acetobacter oeni TaxID=304077 RepID=A0A511XQJ0_9PROT|nr:substrate-binding domain-containing protein [Acetobacter oeni]MBB3884835.1 ribose transport system substrate-binding protein [Acetobacter oeni]NHO20777.1 substrate-binding domain-containing protein [Acetobacter oeni]GBR10049.1 sugar ABC transporter substrate-binding periplasmic protein [Acetobacter oeni LMG 21952]GEN65212.1 sugar ABC transporter substrate-binding protein [Acetobacter oeni]